MLTDGAAVMAGVAITAPFLDNNVPDEFWMQYMAQYLNSAIKYVVATYCVDPTLQVVAQEFIQ